MDINAEHVSGSVYLDNGATTKVDARVAASMVEAMTEAYGNPSSAHRLGVEAARRVAEARERVARALSAQPDEIIFTSGGTEANALGFFGAAQLARGKHAIVSAFEHPSILDGAQRLEQLGWKVTRLPVGPSGVVDPARLAEAVTGDTGVVGLLWVQNEIGTVQPIADCAHAIKAKAPRCHVHVDAVQAVGKISVDVTAQPIDSLSLSAHKIHGPKGAGALWLRKGARVEARQFGGAQERGLRPGTEGVPGIVGLGLAVELAERARPEAARRMSALREKLWALISTARPGVRRHGDPERAAPHVLSVGFPSLPAEPLLHALEARGVCASAGSACHARAKKPSVTLREIGVPDDTGTLRFSLSRETTEDEIIRAAAAVAAAAEEIA